MGRLAAVLVLWSLPAFAGASKLTFIFSGDEGGEIAPCG